MIYGMDFGHVFDAVVLSAVAHVDPATTKGMMQSAALNAGVNLHRKPWKNDRVLNIIVGFCVAGMFYPVLQPLAKLALPHWAVDAVNSMAILASTFWAFFVKWALEICWNWKEAVIYWIKNNIGGHHND